MTTVRNAFTNHIFHVLAVATFLGLTVGTVEAIGLFALQKINAIAWNRAGWYISVEVIPIVILTNFLILELAGIVLAVVTVVFKRRLEYSVFCLAFLSSVALLNISGLLHRYATWSLGLGIAVAIYRGFSSSSGALLPVVKRCIPWLASGVIVLITFVYCWVWGTEAWAVAHLPSPRRPSPNVILIVIDTLRADHVSSYKYSRRTTPNIDRLAREGILFENAYSPSSWSLPSHASMVTGLDPYEHRALAQLGGSSPWVSYLASGFPTVSGMLAGRGYRTGAFSGNTFWFGRNRGFGTGFIHFEDAPQSPLGIAMVSYLGQRGVIRLCEIDLIPCDLERVSAQQVTESTLRWIEKDKQRPFFAMLNYFDLHHPYQRNADCRANIPNTKSADRLNAFISNGLGEIEPADITDGVAVYDDLITCIDAQIGRLISGLRGLGLSENTCVIVVSDHGESFGDNGLFFHGKGLNRHLLHVPLVFWYPHGIPSGVRISEPVTTTALPSTIWNVSQEEEGRPFKPLSLVGLWQSGAHLSAEGHVLGELAQEPRSAESRYPVDSGGMKSLITSQWQYIAHEKLGEKLFDLEKDPREENDVSNSKEGDKIIEPLRQYLSERLGTLHY